MGPGILAIRETQRNSGERYSISSLFAGLRRSTAICLGSVFGVARRPQGQLANGKTESEAGKGGRKNNLLQRDDTLTVSEKIANRC